MVSSSCFVVDSGDMFEDKNLEKKIVLRGVISKMIENDDHTG